MDNSGYGGFIVSRNVLNGVAVRYTYREKSSKPELNGWHILSEADDDDYIRQPSNFAIVSAETLMPYCAVLLTFFQAPYGTDLFWEYDIHGNLAGFYDLKKEQEVTIEQIMSNNPEKPEEE